MGTPEFKFHAFLSHNGAQKAWTRELARKLRAQGFAVFFDEDSIELGEDVPRAIENGLRSSRHVLLVLSPAALTSSWVALEYSASLYKDPGAADRVLIPIVREQCDLPLILGRLNYLDATNDDEIDRQLERLTKAIDKQAVIPVPNVETAAPARALNPTASSRLKARSFGLPVGMPVEAGNAYYAERDADLAVRRLVEEGGTLTVSGARRMGKTSLLRRASHYAQECGKTAVHIDIQMFQGGDSKPQIFYGIARQISASLGLAEPPAPLFLEHSTSAFNRVLGSMPDGTVLMLDEYDFLKSIGVLDSFSGALRAFVNSAHRRGQRPTVLIASVALPSEFIEDPLQSSFNIGESIALLPLTRREAESVFRAAVPRLSMTDADKLYELVGGNPFFLNVGLRHLSEGRSWEEFDIAHPSSPFRDFLFFTEASVDKAVLKKLKRSGLSHLDPRSIDHLARHGIVIAASGQQAGPVWAGRIYMDYFNQRSRGVA